ncbi:MAG: tetratricopeptide repeat protein [bacterium]
MKTVIILSLVLFLTLNLYAQDSKVEELVSEGTALHDQGKYDEAIAKYKAALEINNNSPLANYEMSYSCYSAQRYDEAVDFSEKVIDLESGFLHEAYIVLGSSYDMLGKQRKAIKAYKKALKIFPKSNMLNYNLALTLFNKEDYEEAEEAATNAILANPYHASSHFLLGSIKTQIGERVKALLPLYYYLILEPDKPRSKLAYRTINQLLGSGTRESDGNTIQAIIPGYAKTDDSFLSVEMFLALSSASKFLKKDEPTNEMEEFIKTNRMLFDVVERTGKAEKGSVWDFYILKFRDLLKTENADAFSYFISISTYPDVVTKWFSENPDKLEKLKNWMVQ